MAKSDGKAAVVEVITAAASAATAEAAAIDGEQLDMLMPPARANMTEDERTRAETSIRRDRAGRPPGARNIATRQMLDYLRKTMGDPLMERFRWAMHTPESLSIALGCTKLEAFDRLDKIRADLARFFYAQMAQVDGQGNAVTPRLTMVFPGQSAQPIGADGAPQAPWLYLEAVKNDNAEVQQNQGFLASAEDVSHGELSHGEHIDSNISDLERSGR